VVVLDYGSGNVRSACRALERAGATVTLTADRSRAAAADGLVVPGVGAFATCMSGLEAVGAGELIWQRRQDGRAVLGICVGMQVMFEAGAEHGVVTKGLGLVPGTVTRLAAPVVPHMGWNVVRWPAGARLAAGLPAQARFYFVHSYAAKPAADIPGAALADHGGPFVAAFDTGVLAAAQFHPEKSGDAGATLLSNWVRSLA